MGGGGKSCLAAPLLRDAIARQRVLEFLALGSSPPRVGILLLSRGRVLRDPETLATHRVDDGQTPHMVARPLGAPARADATATSAATFATNLSLIHI